MSSREREPSAVVWQLKITLKGSTPPIWRRILVPGDTSLAKLHRILQLVLGWWNCHLHQFTIHGRDFGAPDDDLPEFSNTLEDEKDVKLMDVLHGVKDRFVYQYDFGDDWLHQIVVEKVIPREKGKRYPACIAGARACPPEDCGGIWGYRNFLKAINDRKHPEHKAMTEWFGAGFHPEAFDVEAINRQLRGIK